MSILSKLDELSSGKVNFTEVDLNELEKSFKAEKERLMGLSAAERITECENIAKKLPDVIKAGEACCVKIETQQTNIQNMLGSTKEAAKAEFGVDNSDELRAIYKQSMDEYTELVALTNVLLKKAQNQITEAEESYQAAMKDLNSLNK